MKDMSKIVEIKKMWSVDLNCRTLIMFLECGHGYVHVGNQEVGETTYCSKCAQGL